MKKHIITITLLWAFAQSAMSAVVTPERAAGYAAGIMGMSSAPVAEVSVQQRVAGRNGAQAPEYYVFNNPKGGWVIIAADDRVSPVLAYSETGSFNVDDMPTNVSWWMDDVAKYIDLARELDVDATDEVLRAWGTLETLGDIPVNGKKVLKTALWDQGTPFNDLCPIATGDNTRSYTGCVATAMSIIARYHSWPEKGKGVIGGYTADPYNSYIAPYSIDNHVYEWEKMPLNTTDDNVDSWTSEQKFQVAQLIHDCGVMVRMGYSADGSGAYSNEVAYELKEHMSYAESTTYVERSAYTSDEWFDIIRTEIDADRVVYYAGQGNVGGHAFVCDGYEATDLSNKIRINWGWGGSFNGFYTLDLRIELSSSNYEEFGSSQKAIIGIVPDTVSISEPEIRAIVQYPYRDYFGLTRSSYFTDLSQGKRIRFVLGYFANLSDNEISQDYVVCLMDSSGTIRQQGWAATIDFPAQNGYVYNGITDSTALEVTPALTDYFQLFAKEGDDLVAVKPNYDWFPDGKGIICGVTVDPVIILPETYSVGDVIPLKLSNGFAPLKSVQWKVDGEDYVEDKIVLKSGTTELSADLEFFDDTESTVSVIITVE